MKYSYLISDSYVENNDLHRCVYDVFTKRKIKYALKKIIKMRSEHHKADYIHIENIEYTGMRSQ